MRNVKGICAIYAYGQSFSESSIDICCVKKSNGTNWLSHWCCQLRANCLRVYVWLPTCYELNGT
jgi:hypothetical protein